MDIFILDILMIFSKDLNPMLILINYLLIEKLVFSELVILHLKLFMILKKMRK